MIPLLQDILRIARAEARRLLVASLRYRLEFLGSALAIYGAFFLLRFTAGVVPGALAAFAGDLHRAGLLYVLWLWSYAVIGSVQGQLSSDLASGALETMLAALPRGEAFIVGRAVGFALQCAVLCSPLGTGLVAWAVLHEHAVAWTGVLAAFALALANSIALACAISGLVVLYKRVSLVMAPISIALMAVMMAPASASSPTALACIPYMAAKELLVAAVADASAPGTLAWGTLAACFYLAAGLRIWSACEAAAKRRGSLSLA